MCGQPIRADRGRRGDLADGFAAAGGNLRLYQIDCDAACPVRIGLGKSASSGRVVLRYLP